MRPRARGTVRLAPRGLVNVPLPRPTRAAGALTVIGPNVPESDSPASSVTVTVTVNDPPPV